MSYFLKVDEIRYYHGRVNKVFIDMYKIISLKEVSSDTDFRIEDKESKLVDFNLLEQGYKTIIKLERDTYYSKVAVEKLMKICNFNIVEE